jgi:hypothetical protein
MNPVRTIPRYFSKIHLNIILNIIFLVVYFYLAFPPKFYMNFTSPPCALHALPLILLDLLILILFCEKYTL